MIVERVVLETVRTQFDDWPALALTIDLQSATIVLFPRRAGVTQLVECNLAKVDVAGSNPVSRSIPKHRRPRSEQSPGAPGWIIPFFAI